MIGKHKHSRLIWVVALGIVMLTSAVVFGQPQDMGGWDLDGEYNRYFDVREIDEFKCTVKKIYEMTPLPGMAPGIALLVKESEEDTIPVHVCPVWYKKTKELRLKAGDRIKIRGAWAEIDGEDVFMATKIKKGSETILKIRLTKSGKPFWVMDEAERERELNSD